jgi:hypothetical protein
MCGTENTWDPYVIFKKGFLFRSSENALPNGKKKA